MSAVCVFAEPRGEFFCRAEGKGPGEPRGEFVQRPEKAEELESFIKENFADEADEVISWLETLKTYRPEEYRDKVREFARKMKMLGRLKDKVPQKYEAYISAIKLEIKSSKLGKEYGEAETEEEKERVKGELRGVLEELFEIKQAQNEERIKHIEERLSELKERNSQRKEHKEEIINGRLEQITASESGLGW